MIREQTLDEAVRRVIPRNKLGAALVEFLGSPYGYTAVFMWHPNVVAEFRRLWEVASG